MSGVRAGRYFVWRLLHLIGLDESSISQHQNDTIELGRVFYADISFWKWAVYHELLLTGGALSAPCHTTRKQPEKRHYSICCIPRQRWVVNGFSFERMVLCPYGMPVNLTSQNANETKPIAGRSVPSLSTCPRYWEWS